MKKKFTLLLTVLFTLFTLPVSSLTVLAADENKVFEDGEYEVPLNFLHSEKNEDSTMQNYNKDGKASVTINGEKALVKTTFTSASMIKDFKVNNENAIVVNDNEDDDERTYSFTITVANLEGLITGKVSVEVPNMYSSTHDILLKFDTSDIPLVNNDDAGSEEGTEEDTGSEEGTEEDTGSEEGTEEDAGSEEGTEEDTESEEGTEEDTGSEEGTEEDTGSEEGTEEDTGSEEGTEEDADSEEGTNGDKESEELIESEDPVDPESMKDGIYEVKYDVDYEGADFSHHFTQPATLTLDNDEVYLEFKHKDANFILGITIPTGEVDVISEDKTTQTRVIGFNIGKDLKKSVDMGLEMFYGQTHDVKLNFDLSTLKMVEAFPAPEPKPESKPVVEPKPVIVPEKNQLVPDKAYEINYTIKDEHGTKISAADNFFVKPGILLEKDGVLYAQFTITEGEMVKELSSKYGAALVVKRNEDGSIVVQFKVDKDLKNMNLNMTIDVPGVYDNKKHKTVLVFDKGSQKQIDVGEYKLAASDSVNGPTVKDAVEGKPLGEGNESTDNTEENKNTIEVNGSDNLNKPTFGSNDKNGQEVAASTKGSHNPQTGDTSSILFYTLLLIGSMVPLAVKFRRRFV